MRRGRRFMDGRHGHDELSMFTSFLSCILLIVAMFARGVAGSILWLLAFFGLIGTYFRILSRNSARRDRENAAFLDMTRPVTDMIARRRQRKRQKNLYCFFKCPQCSTVLRVPKGKGHIRITCKCCSHVFERNS